MKHLPRMLFLSSLLLGTSISSAWAQIDEFTHTHYECGDEGGFDYDAWLEEERQREEEERQREEDERAQDALNTVPEEIVITGVRTKEAPRVLSCIDEGTCIDRPEGPPCDSLSELEVKQAQCKVSLNDAFKSASEECGGYGAEAAAVAVAAGAFAAESTNKYVKVASYIVAGAAVIIGSTDIFGTVCPSPTDLQADKDQCDLNYAEFKLACGY